ncbi:hypothetical protein D3C84_388300 [compost metagenome]
MSEASAVCASTTATDTCLFKLNTEVTPDAMCMLAHTGDISIAKARRLLGYEPKVSLEDGLRRSEDWLRVNGQIAP